MVRSMSQWINRGPEHDLGRQYRARAGMRSRNESRDGGRNCPGVRDDVLPHTRFGPVQSGSHQRVDWPAWRALSGPMALFRLRRCLARIRVLEGVPARPPNLFRRQLRVPGEPAFVLSLIG